MKVDCLILAAGKSTRYGSCKLLAPWRGQTLVDRVVESVVALPLESLNLVTGAYHQKIAQHFAVQEPKTGLRLIEFENWQQGMGHSIAYGVSQLPVANAVLVLLGDQPLINTQDLQRLFSTWQQNPTQTVCASFNQIRGVPALFPASAKRELLSLSGDKGARSLLAKDTWPITTVEMPNAGFDVDTPSDVEKLLLGKH